MKAVARRVSDGSVLRLLKSWLRAPIVEEDKDGTKRVIPNRRGTPQGGVISPLLANLYLNPLDHGVNGKRPGPAQMVRYADDFVIACATGRGQGMRERLKKWLHAKGLTLNEAKTRLVNIRQEGINFLGFNLTWRKSFQGRGYLHVQPSQKGRGHLARETRRTPQPLDAGTVDTGRGGGHQPGLARMGRLLPLRQQCHGHEPDEA